MLRALLCKKRVLGERADGKQKRAPGSAAVGEKVLPV